MTINSNLKKSKTKRQPFIKQDSSCLKTMNLALKMQKSMQRESKICKV